jgi:ribose transport system substrate-binding protein
MKKVLGMLTLVVIVILAITKLGFINKSNEKRKERKTFGATFMSLNNPYFVELGLGLKGVIEENGDKLIMRDPQLDVKKQISIIEEMINQKVDGIFLNPADWIEIKPALEKARKANIPVFVLDTSVYNKDLVVTTVVSDNENAGILCARHLTEVLKITEGNIVILEHPTAKSAIERTDSFINEIKKFPNLKIIAKNSSDGQVEISMKIMEDILDSHKNEKISAIMALNDPTAFGVIAALERKGRMKEVKAIYGVDGSSDAYKLIEAGKMTATAAQYPKEIGKIAAESAYKFISGEKISKEIKVPVKLITLEDIK